MHTHCTQLKPDVNKKTKKKFHRKDVAEQFCVCQKREGKYEKNLHIQKKKFIFLEINLKNINNFFLKRPKIQCKKQLIKNTRGA